MYVSHMYQCVSGWIWASRITHVSVRIRSASKKRMYHACICTYHVYQEWCVSGYMYHACIRVYLRVSHTLCITHMYQVCRIRCIRCVS